MVTEEYPLSVHIKLPHGVEYDQPTGLYINGQFVKSKQGKTFEVVSPSTEDIVCSVYEALEEDVNAAVDAAENAFKNTNWATQEPSVRGLCLLKLADLVEKHAEVLAGIESLDNGKSLFCSRGDVTLTAAYFRSCAGYADKVDGRLIDTGSNHLSYTKREPIGVCGQIIPWNFPLLMAAWKLGPCLATGNVTILKSAESTPLSILYLANYFEEAGIPAGVVNIISGFGKTAGEAIAVHPRIRKVAFTGSTATGRHIMKRAAESNLKKVTLELGGKSPNIIFNDADIAKAAQNMIIGIFYNSGEVCCAGSRIYCQSGIYDALLAEFKKAIGALKVGDPFDETTFQGSQTSQLQLDRILNYIDVGKKEGATLVTGGERVEGKGYFIEPTIFGDVHEEMRIVKEEIFGPVVTITKFESVDEVIQLANDSEYGLAAGVHTEDINKAIDVSNRLKAGTVWINTYNDFHASVPFGGYSQSGIGRELGIEAFDNYTQVKAVRIKIDKKFA